MRAKALGPALVAAACLLWATDALVRMPTVASLDASFIVFCEHLLGTLALLPWILTRSRVNLFKLTRQQWVAAILVGAGGSALATVLFTASFKYVNPSVVILLQKIQPILVVLIAYAVLGEKPERRFYPWAAVALAATVGLTYPDLDFKDFSHGMDHHTQGVLSAFAAALIWAVSTVAGKVLLKGTTSPIATFWRYVFGFLTLGIVVGLSHAPIDWALVGTPRIQFSLLYLSLPPGVIAMLFYYGGLSRTPASVATFVELLYPVSAVILNTLVLHTPLTTLQLGAGAVLLFAVTRISS